jgi:uncharacterized membrane protein
LALLTIGGLFAYFGQTYQTGADPWQLFALWAALALPLCLSVRSEVLWTPWALVAVSAISLWVHAHSGHRWRVVAHEPADLTVHLAGWTAALILTFALGPVFRRFTGAGPWALRTALTLSIILITLTALGGLFHTTVSPAYWLGLAMLAAAAGILALPRFFEIYGLSALSLGLNILIVAGLTRALLDRHHGDVVGPLLLLGLAAAGLLAATVGVVLRLSRRQAIEGVAT